MAESYDALKGRADVIATEEDKGDNTKERLGAMLLALIEKVEEVQGEIPGGSPGGDINGGFEGEAPSGSIDGGFEGA